MTVSPSRKDGIIWRNFVGGPQRVGKHGGVQESFKSSHGPVTPFAGLFLNTVFYFGQKVLKVV